MGLDDKIDNAAEKLGGKSKEAAGHATGDDSLKAEGKTDQSKADLKQAGEKVKDATTGATPSGAAPVGVSRSHPSWRAVPAAASAARR